MAETTTPSETRVAPPETMTQAPKRRRLIQVALALVGLISLAIAANVRWDRPLADLLPKYGTGASRYAVIEGMKVHYRDEGSGPPLVLLHGTSSSLHTWDGWVKRMRSERRIIRLDLPGFGLTGAAPDGDYRAARDARIVVKLLDRLGVERADIAGNSFGGRVALTLALDHPDSVSSLTLIGSRGLSGVPPTAIERAAKIPVLGSALRWITPRSLIRRGIEDLYFEPSKVTGDLLDRYDDLMHREGNRQALVEMMTGSGDPDLDSQLREISVPVLIQWGKHDRRIPLSVAYRLRDGLRDANLIVYDDAGHLPMEEIPDATAADAECFLKGGTLGQRGQLKESESPTRRERLETGCHLPEAQVGRAGKLATPRAARI